MYENYEYITSQHCPYQYFVFYLCEYIYLYIHLISDFRLLYLFIS